jgi:hypothetical protein
LLGAMSLGLLNDQERFFAYWANYTTFRTDSSRSNLTIFLTVLLGGGRARVTIAESERLPDCEEIH